MDHESSYDEPDPTNDKNNLDFISALAALLLFPFPFTNANSFYIQLIRRKRLLTPIFYQSNYVIVPPLKY